MHGPDITWYVVLAAMLFAIGAVGVLVRRSPLIILLSVEIMLNGANLALIAFANLANIRLARAIGERGDVALRLALGANQRALLQAEVAEGAIIACGGGAWLNGRASHAASASH